MVSSVRGDENPANTRYFVYSSYTHILFISEGCHTVARASGSPQGPTLGCP
jgi:hypothetical protein